jgi:hypothetical protein
MLPPADANITAPGTSGGGDGHWNAVAAMMVSGMRAALPA